MADKKETTYKNSAPLQGSLLSPYEVGILTSNISNQDLVLATFNPLVTMLSSTITQTSFSKPFYPTVYKKNGDVDELATAQITEDFENIDFISWAMVGQNDAFNLGIGPAEVAYQHNEETKRFEFVSMERRPPDTFIFPKDRKITSSSQRWKGIYFRDGLRQFDQTIVGKGVIKLNPQQMFYVLPTSAKYPDGPGTLESLLAMLDGCQTSFGLTFQVMANQIDPQELKISGNVPNSESIIQKFVEENNSYDTVPIPSEITIEHPRYYDKTDILDFFKFYENMLYKIVFPTSVLSSEGGGLLDASSSYAKEDIFFTNIDFSRYRIRTGTQQIGNLWLDLNGYKKQGYKFQLVAPPVAPRNIQTEKEIMLESYKQGGISKGELREWLSQTVIGLELEQEIEEVGAQAQFMVKASRLDNIAKSKALHDILKEDKDLRDLDKLFEEAARKSFK